LVTMTCNPQWPEIRGADACAQWSSDRIAVHASHLPRPQDRVVPGYSRTSPDAVKYLYKYVYKGTDRIMPRPSTHTLPTPPIVAVTEFQKKSLPHVHILVCLSTKLTTTAQFDAVVSAEIPSTDAPELRALVLKHMIHSPCEHDTSCPCRQGPSDDTGDAVVVQCQKFFPKPFQVSTQSDPNDSYPEYMRRGASDGGQTGTTPGTRMHPGVAVDNSWVVPYNPALLAMFDCHINVEVTSSIDCVKYLYKYVYKGTDRIMYKLRSANGFTGDEIEEYRAARYLTATEAFFSSSRSSVSICGLPCCHSWCIPLSRTRSRCHRTTSTTRMNCRTPFLRSWTKAWRRHNSPNTSSFVLIWLTRTTSAIP